MKKGFTLIELLVVVAIIGILAAVGVVAYSGYTTSAKANSSRENMTVVYKTWLNEKYLCETKASNDQALWGKTQCHVLLSSSSSYIARVAGVISNYFGANNNYGFGQPILNTFRPQKSFFTDNCWVKVEQDANIGELVACFDKSTKVINFRGCFKTPCSEASNRFNKYIRF